MSLQRLRRSQPPSANKMLSESPTVTGNWRIEEAAYPCVGASFDRAGMLAQWYNLLLDTRETGFSLILPVNGQDSCHDRDLRVTDHLQFFEFTVHSFLSANDSIIWGVALACQAPG